MTTTTTAHPKRAPANAPTADEPVTRTAAAPRTLAAARQAFGAAIKREMPGTDLPRFEAILDALVAWSVARPKRLVFRTAASADGVLSFEHAGAKVIFWSVRTVSRSAPTLELSPPAGRSLTPGGRAHALETLNAHSREVRVEGDRLRIGFGALKNAAALAAVLALMDDLLTGDERAAAAA